MSEHLEHERPRRRRRWAIISAAVAGVALVAGGAGAAAVYLASGDDTPQATQPSPTIAADEGDVVGKRVCSASLEMVGDALEFGADWEQDEWFDWWDDAYDEGGRLKVTSTAALQDIGRRADDTDPADMLDVMVEVVTTCVEGDLLARDQLRGVVLDAIDDPATIDG